MKRHIYDQTLSLFPIEYPDAVQPREEEQRKAHLAKLSANIKAEFHTGYYERCPNPADDGVYGVMERVPQNKRPSCTLVRRPVKKYRKTI